MKEYFVTERIKNGYRTEEGPAVPSSRAMLNRVPVPPEVLDGFEDEEIAELLAFQDPQTSVIYLCLPAGKFYPDGPRSSYAGSGEAK